MKKNNNTQKRNSVFVRFGFNSLRNLSSPEDLAKERKIYGGQIPLKSILELPTNENVRAYLPESTGKQKRAYTSVHKAIRETLLVDSDSFSVLNSGVVIVAREITNIDEKERILTLVDPSIINGAQTQGVIKDLYNIGQLPENIHMKFEIIVTQDEDLIAEVSIARNYQNDVMAVSIAGRRGHFDELEKALQNGMPDLKLRKSESEYPNNLDMVDTEKLLQVITALIPKQLWPRAGEGDSPNKVYTYSMKARCLKEFQDIYSKRDEEYSNLYKFYLDVAADAWRLYNKWKCHQGFAGSGLRSIERNGKEIVEVPDGIIFPIIAALSVFAEKKARKWFLNIPADKVDRLLIETATRSYKEIAGHNPQSMGKSKACYSSLLQISDLFKTLSKS